jgi:hypothetical protein
MNPLQPNQQPSEFKPGQLDRILSQEDALLPSSGFAASVMDAIQQHSAQPEPIPFPWKRALPGFVALLAGIVIAIRLATAALRNPRTFPIDFRPAQAIVAQAIAQTMIQAGPILLALAAALACILLTRRLAMGRPSR